MLLNLSEDQEFFRETTDRFLTEQVPPDAVRALRHDATGFDPAYWRRGAELGWTSLLVSEENGGGTISGVRAGRPQSRGLRVRSPRRAGTAGHDQRGRRNTQCPRSGTRRAGVPALGRGDRHLVRPGGRARRLATRLSRRGHDGTDLVLRGEVRPVESAGTAAHLLVTCGDGGGTTQVLVPTSATGVTVSPMQTVDLTRRFSVVDLRRRAGPRRRGGRGDGGGRRRTSTVSSRCSWSSSTRSRSGPCRPGST